MRTVSVIALAILVLFLFGGQMNTSAGRAEWTRPAVTTAESSVQSSLAGTVELTHHKSANGREVHPARWLNQFEPLLLLLLGSVLLSVATGIRLLTRK